MTDAPPQRVKVVSLRVGYKSATVDEFVERHALDVNRSGIYLQTAHPLPIGTKLKIEIRIASGQTVLVAFGRVVWKRDGTRASAVRPPGMGVRFIKLDEPSTKLLDELVSARPDAGLAYEEGLETESADVPRAVARLEGSKVGRRPLRSPVPGHPVRNATLMGIGGGAMFPPTEPAAEAPEDEELTVVTRLDDVLDELSEEAQGSEPEDTSTVIERPIPASHAPEAPKRQRGSRNRRTAGMLVALGTVTAGAFALTMHRPGLQSSRPVAVAASTSEAVQALPVSSASATPSVGLPSLPSETGPALADAAPVAPGPPAATATLAPDVRPKPPIVHRKPAGATTTAGGPSKPKWLLHPAKVDNPY